VAGGVEEAPGGTVRREEAPPSLIRRRGFWIALELALVLSLLGAWVGSEAVRSGDHLGILFLYSFPSEFLVGLVPHEPVLVHFGRVHEAWLVALVAGVGTVLAEAINYSIFGFFYQRPTLRGVGHRPSVRKVTELFSRRPFTAVVVAGFSPLPFFPIRFLVVMTAYPRARYLAGVALSRTPRFFILAAFGGFFEIPEGLLSALMVGMLLTVNLPALAGLLRGPRGDEPRPGEGAASGFTPRKP
jgi:membrane protein YqaA with SNARE-associated domain